MPSQSVWSDFRDRLRQFLPARFRPQHPVVAVVRLSGVIGTLLPFRPGLSISSCGPALERAFTLPEAKAVAIVINSPGGSAVQSHLIFMRIRALAEEKRLPVFVFIEDAGASGGYMIACAGDEIIADASSIVGSIGVVAAGFGLDRLIERFGVERRIYTTGPQKAMLDPFRPEKPEDVARLKTLQERVHALFVKLVENRRGAKLRAAREDLFSGAIWTGSEAAELGLIDRVGELRTVMRERYGEKVKLRPVAIARPGLLARLLGRREQTVESASLIDPAALIAALEERAAWARLGL